MIDRSVNYLGNFGKENGEWLDFFSKNNKRRGGTSIREVRVIGLYNSMN